MDNAYITMADLCREPGLLLSLPSDAYYASISTSVVPRSSSSLSISAPTLAMSTSVAAFDLRALPLPGPGGFAFALEASTFARKAGHERCEQRCRPQSPPASSCSSNGTRFSAGPKSISTMALMTSVAVTDFPDLDKAWSCALTISA